MYENINNMTANGGTLFGPVIDNMLQFINERNIKNLYCVWLSDGQDNRGLDILMPKMADFKLYMQNLGVSCAVHCIGFTENHDADLLNRLSLSGTRKGSFQYVPSGGRIPVAVNNIFELAFESSLYAKFIADDGKVQKIINLEDDPERPGITRGTVYISEEDMEDCEVELYLAGSI